MNDEEIFRKGLIVDKTEQLNRHKVNANTNFEAMHFQWIRNRIKMESIDIDQLRTITSNWLNEIEDAQAVHLELKDLEG